MHLCVICRYCSLLSLDFVCVAATASTLRPSATRIGQSLDVTMATMGSTDRHLLHRNLY
ncbi:hypothetical protein PR001_g9028 [Phytophthora rubi]|uniref:Uncharacterized protein n=1 Tax=Phytophthora rubi TaxID=129364 RepID=A0A6A3KHC4_9STRA|nr:hypothetical protein PR002_g17410 [Phytophthora rubi]KAE9036020.1 hypothetical protein PR001_g9028 [Phytophthora rubi]